MIAMHAALVAAVLPQPLAFSAWGPPQRYTQGWAPAPMGEEGGADALGLDLDGEASLGLSQAEAAAGLGSRKRRAGNVQGLRGRQLAKRSRNATHYSNDPGIDLDLDTILREVRLIPPPPRLLRMLVCSA